MGIAVTVVDYRAGNLTSVAKALRAAGAEVSVTTRVEDVESATRIVLPGVGHFAATARLEPGGMAQGGLKQAMLRAIESGVPLLGICVGMQWLFEGSTEAPDVPGAGYFAGRVTRFPAGGEKVPHVGWNQLEVVSETPLLAGVKSGEFAYFTHAWRAPVSEATVAATEYMGVFAAACQRGNVCGVQFHPEKSGATGLRILRNFLEMAAC